MRASRLLLLLPAMAWALDPRTPITQYHVSTWSTPQGLPDSFIQAIAQTSDGYLWLGTQEGLVRFDGIRFAHFDTKNTPLLKHNSIVALRAARDGVLWIGSSGGGVTWHDGRRFVKSFTTANGLPNNYIREVYEEPSGDVLLTAHEGGLARYARGGFSTLRKAQGLATESLRTMLMDRMGRLWIGADEEGLYRLAAGKLEYLGSPPGPGNNQIRVLFEDRAGRVWVGTRNGGLHVYQDGRYRSFTRRDGLPSNAIRAMLEDRDGNLWIGTESGGLARYRDGVFATLGTRDGLPHNFVRSLHEDRDGNLWVGTRGGLCRLRDRRVTTLTTSDGLAHDLVRTLHQDTKERLWIGTALGLNSVRHNAISLAKLSGDAAKDNMRSIAQGGEGRLWFGEERGLYLWNEGKVRRFGSGDGLPEVLVRAMLEDREGVLWAGTSVGLYRMPPGERFSRVPTPLGNEDDEIRALSQDRQGAIWLGASEGLFRFDGGNWRRFTSADGLANNFVTCFGHGNDGALWIGTRGGLSRYYQGKFTTFTRRDGLLSDNIYGAVEDDFGHLWLSSLRGVSRLDRQELLDFAAAKVRELHPVSFDTSDGMKSSECTGHSQPSAAKTRDGRVWFPTIQGVVGFDPRQAPQRRSPPTVLVEGAFAGKVPLAIEDEGVEVPAGPGNLEIQFTAIRLSAPQRLRFRYRLEGYDEDWVEAGDRRSAFYTNLPPGDFQFRVAVHDNGGPNLNEAAVPLRVAPRFYQTSWFFAAFLCALAGVGVFAYRLRIAYVRRQYELVLGERTRIAREVHDTLMQGVTGISLQLEVASQQMIESPAEAKSRVDRSLARLDGVLAEARQCILELRAHDPVDGDLGRALRRLTEELSEGHAIRTEVQVEGASRKLSPRIETELLRIAREAITNAIVHSSATLLTVVLRFEPRAVRLSLADDGKGFDACLVPDSHFGLRGMKERAQQIGGDWRVQSAPGNGTTVEVAVPVH
jgi:ligand-binding sensor domain-containing protein/two-component sensor histidine kinase